MLDYKKRAIKPGYASHPDRYDKDPAYRAACISHSPPTPRMLQFSHGGFSAEDGNDVRPPDARLGNIS